MVDSRDITDAPAELQQAAGAHLTRDFTEAAWREGPRAKRRTGLAFGGAVAAAVTAIAVLGGPLANLRSGDGDVAPAGTSADAPTSQDTTEATGDDSQETTTQEGMRDLIPLSNGVAMRPIPGWQAVPVGTPSGDRGLQADFETCLQPEGEEISRVQCLGGVFIRTGTNGPEAEESGVAEFELPDLGVEMYEGSPSSGTGDGPPGLSYSEIEEAIVEAPSHVILDVAVLGDTSISDGVLSGSVKEQSSLGTYESEGEAGGVAMVITDENASFTVSETALCTEDNGSAAPTRVIDCAELTKRIEADPDLAISVIHDQDDVMLRMSEDPRHYG